MISVAVVLLGFLVATLLIIVVGRNPGGMYEAILQVLTGFSRNRSNVWVWNSRYIGEWLASSLPLILCGLSMGFAARTGLFNIGADGQYIIGITAAQFVALYGPPIPVLHWCLAILAAIVASALWGGIVGFFKAR
ncbi:MAG: ABC transporter permease, partial [Treponema sp.]|nr:ABC transporter permease [Treponema sp.]